MTDLKTPRGYTNEEAASIISGMLDRQNEGGRISHDELLETARAIGVTTSQLEAAVIEAAKRRAERFEIEERQAAAVRRFLQHFSVFIVANAFCFVLDKKLTGGVWFYWVGLVWAIFLAVHALRTFRPKVAPAPESATPQVLVVGSDDRKIASR